MASRPPAMRARRAPRLRPCSDPPAWEAPHGAAHSPSRHTPLRHLGHELLSVPPQDPRWVLHVPGPLPLLSHPLPPPRTGPGEDHRVGGTRSVLPSLTHTCASGEFWLPILTPSRHLPTHQARQGRGLAWGAWEGPLLKSWATSRKRSSASASHCSPLGLEGGPRGSQDPSHHLPVLPRLQKRLPVTLVCPCTWGLG